MGGACSRDRMRDCWFVCSVCARQDCEPLWLADAEGTRFRFGGARAIASPCRTHVSLATVAPSKRARCMHATRLPARLQEPHWHWIARDLGGKRHTVERARLWRQQGCLPAAACLIMMTAHAIPGADSCPRRCRLSVAGLVAVAGPGLSAAQVANQARLRAREAIARYYDGALACDDELTPLATRNVCLRTQVGQRAQVHGLSCKPRIAPQLLCGCADSQSGNASGSHRAPHWYLHASCVHSPLLPACAA